MSHHLLNRVATHPKPHAVRGHEHIQRIIKQGSQRAT